MKMLGTTPESPKGVSRNSLTHGRLPKGIGTQGPSMATIQMVSALIKDSKEYPSKYQLWRSLPKGRGMNYPRLEAVLNYLESTNQIMIDKDGAIIWILADNPKLKKLMAESTRLR